MTHQEAGSKGGRPRLLTLEQRQQQLSGEINKEDCTRSSNVRILRRLYLHGKSSRENTSGRAETPARGAKE